jgi:hypothetical protein
MSDLSLDILREIEAEGGWRLWNLGQHTRGDWHCRLYNTRVPARGANSGFLSPDGFGPTPHAAILNALGRVDDEGPMAKVRAETLARLEANMAAIAAQLEGPLR